MIMEPAGGGAVGGEVAGRDGLGAAAAAPAHESKPAYGA
jgi:hypothetical protein